METKSILIVDDEKNICLTLSQALETLGVETDAALNGEEALAKLKNKEFGLILLDLKMPGMSRDNRFVHFHVQDPKSKIQTDVGMNLVLK